MGFAALQVPGCGWWLFRPGRPGHAVCGLMLRKRLFHMFVLGGVVAGAGYDSGVTARADGGGVTTREAAWATIDVDHRQHRNVAEVR